MKQILLPTHVKTPAEGHPGLQSDPFGRPIEEGVTSTAACHETIQVSDTALSVDTALLSACAEAANWDRRLRDANARGAHKDDCDAAIEGWDKTFLRVARLRARTTEGMRAKAVVLQMALRREHELTAAYGPSDTFTPKALLDDHDSRKDLYLAWTLAADILEKVF